MINNRFELYKIKREIKRSGSFYSFYRNAFNEFGEPKKDYVKIHTINALYYEHAAHYLDTYMMITGIESARYRVEKTPQLICPYEDMFFKSLNSDGEEVDDVLRIGDFVSFNGHLSKITGIFNIQEWNKIITISFEEVDYGSKSLLPGGQQNIN